METIRGTVERVTFHTEDTGYSVLKVTVALRADPVTVVGKVADIHAGEEIEATGEWTQAANWGRQFRAESISTKAPATRDAIEKYLGSGLIEGIGPVYAKKLVSKFGDRIFDVIDQESKRLEEVDGIGQKRRREIKNSWEKQKSVREIMVFLHQNGISTAKAVKIFQTYGSMAMQQVQANPYKLAEDIHGIGFKTADGIARRMGLEPDSPERIRAGLFHLLLAASDDGHCALPVTELQQRGCTLLEVAENLIAPQLQGMVDQREVIRETIAGEELIFPPHLARAEELIAARLAMLLAQPPQYPPMDADRALAWAQEKTGKPLAPTQAEAVRRALTSRVLIITGGPGVGKTTILHTILKILRAKNMKCVLAAPTGRAARRMSESTGVEAKTIHRLLEYQPGKGFTRNTSRALEGDLFVLDETSMIDVPLMAAFLQAVPAHAHLLLVGDADQLPSVGPGSLLRDLIASERIPVVRLTEIFRQARTSRIITAAHAINAGILPDISGAQERGSDFFFIERETPEAIAETVVHLAEKRMPEAFGLDPLRDIQVLTPMNRGLLGTQNLNRLLQAALNPPREFKTEVDRYGMTFRVGDKVIQTRNNYEKDVFNGDIGCISRIDAEPLQLWVRFEDERVVDYQTAEFDELRPACAITIHKSQGSEFPGVIIPVSTQHYVMLQRNLIYTGITRGKTCVVLVGDPKALGIAARSAGGLKRWSGLLPRLRGLPQS
ncbi:MAG: ATP-dependent RecD-like DNA helicase [Verrucomicrobiales bacterium]|nr:ATP-dependent RecD-like DNA helicase [Verrucomicrobiales bacterium]